MFFYGFCSSSTTVRPNAGICVLNALSRELSTDFVNFWSKSTADEDPNAKTVSAFCIFYVSDGFYRIELCAVFGRLLLFTRWIITEPLIDYDVDNSSIRKDPTSELGLIVDFSTYLCFYLLFLDCYDYLFLPELISIVFIFRARTTSCS